jgi:hypothetical protein
MVRRLAFLALLLAPAVASAQQAGTVNNPNAGFVMREQVNPPPYYLREPASPVQRAARAFGTCVREAARTLPAGLAPDAASARLMESCDAPFQAVAQAADRVIANARWSEERQAAARAQVTARLALVPDRIAASLRAGRALGTGLFNRR